MLFEAMFVVLVAGILGATAAYYLVRWYIPEERVVLRVVSVCCASLAAAFIAIPLYRNHLGPYFNRGMTNELIHEFAERSEWVLPMRVDEHTIWVRVEAGDRHLTLVYRIHDLDTDLNRRAEWIQQMEDYFGATACQQMNLFNLINLGVTVENIVVREDGAEYATFIINKDFCKRYR